MNKKGKIILSSILGVVVAAILIVSILLIAKPFAPKYDGTLNLEYINEAKETKRVEAGFNEGDTLIEIIERSFDGVKYDDTGYGPFLTEIEGYTTPADYSTYISILVDDKYSEVGISSIVFVDGTKITLLIDSYAG